MSLQATDDERGAIADRLRLTSLDRLEADVVLRKDGDTVEAEGRVRAKVEQACIATGEPVPASIDEPIALRFVPEPKSGNPDEEIELGEDELDTIFHDGQQIALGDALADTLSLALDPYPRSPDADEALRAAGVISEEEAGPFGGLAALKEKMEKGGN
ncbi:DUF177 domain-containing protein [Sphingomicrobium sp. B8]|uniref:DUF177 domain-containing protein n=2 Tax=Sphingomicrobium clamense TaxID=2851013 RepID=A0ABS6V2U0_9SPHN|nr:DUF177 domain-containing protein [Sphingomicrobium sp. B8]MBW0143880.1 DUF177 domain-containing protein [Sphingomicrobium sp. B8]